MGPEQANTPTAARTLARAELVARLGRAIGVLALDGVRPDALSVDRLTTAAGISRSTFYVHFPDRGALMCALIDTLEPTLLAAGSALWDRRRPPSAAEVRESVERVVDAHRSEAAVMAAITEAGTAHPEVSVRLRRLLREEETRVAAHVEWARSAGLCAPDLVPDGTAFWVVRMLYRGLPIHLWPADADATDVRVAALSQVLGRMLYGLSPA